MTAYHVTWEIDIDADTPHEAAAEAARIQADPDTWATVFDVSTPQETVRVDLLEESAR